MVSGLVSVTEAPQGEMGLFGAPRLRGQSTMAAKARQQEREAVCHTVSAAREQRDDCPVLSSLSPFHLVQEPSHKVMLPTLRVDHPISINST